jgi:heme/copper-type cytochrome/quinol oxidase subunit 2
MDEPTRNLLWPQAASSSAAQIDSVYFALLAVALFFVVLIGFLALGYGVKYRAGGDADRSGEVHQTTALEFIWLGAATFLTLSVFAWGAFVFVDLNYPPLDSSTVYVVGKQWMWKVRHATGIREIIQGRHPRRLSSFLRRILRITPRPDARPRRRHGHRRFPEVADPRHRTGRQ